jgi:carboxylate-amine ligase
MDVRTVGIEEEFLLVDPETGRLVERAEAVLRIVRKGETSEAELDVVDRELLRHMLEIRTHPSTDLADLGRQIVATRRTLGTAASETGAALVASGTSPLAHDDVEIAPKARYRDMVAEFGAIGRTAGTCGMHVHVGIESREEGVGVIDRLRPWLPVVLALSVNSPFFADADTGHASWRSQVWTRWPTGGATEIFGSEQAYDALGRDLVATGAARDPGMLYYGARLSADHPTVEVRIADVCTDPDSALIIAAVVRGLVQMAAAEWAADQPPPQWRTEVLRAASWRASRYGLAGTLVSPEARELRPAREVLASVVERTRDVLEAGADLDRVVDGFERLLSATGAVRQRAAYERTGSLEGVVADLVRRTESSWTDAAS